MEDRTLLSAPVSVLPRPTLSVPAGSIVNPPDPYSPTIAIDPMDPLHRIEVNVSQFNFGVNYGLLNINYSTDGGNSWVYWGTIFPEFDPATNGPVVPYSVDSDPSVAFDRLDNFYAVVKESNSGDTSGAIVLTKYNFSGPTPVQDFTVGNPNSFSVNPGDVILDQWENGQDQAYHPVVGIDTNDPSFTDPVQQSTTTAGPFNQWASSVLGFSSQGGKSQPPTGPRTADQALGPPNTTTYGDEPTAWAPSSENGTKEFLSLGYGVPVYATGVDIHETDGNGFVYQVDLIDTSGQTHTVFTGADPTQPGAPGTFHITIPQTSYLVNGVTIYVNTGNGVNAWKEIDAVQLEGVNPGNANTTPTPVQTDTLAVNRVDPTYGLVPKAIYVAWNTNWTEFDTSAQESRIMVTASEDGGHTFSNPAFVGGPGGGPVGSGFSGVGADPKIIFSAPKPYQPGSGGQLVFIWSGLDSGIYTNDSVPDGGVASNPAVAVQDFAGSGSSISGAAGAVTDMTFPVSITNPDLTNVTNVTLNLTIQNETNIQDLEGVLIPPANSNFTPITLFFNHNVGNTGITGVGFDASSTVLGVDSKTGLGPGTTFDSTAYRNIDDLNAKAPFVGHYQPESGSFAEFNGPASALNGTWTVEITAVNKQSKIGFANFSLNVTGTLSNTGFTSDVQGVDSEVVDTLTAFPAFTLPSAVGDVYSDTAVPAFGPLGVGPGLTVAVDNTLGAFSPYAGRIYVAYTGEGDGGPANTFVELMYSDDNGVTWTQYENPDPAAFNPNASLGLPNTAVNDDSATDGFSEGGLRAHFDPQLAVDPITGTVVISYFDTRYDSAQLRLVTSVQTSIDGGQDFSKSIYLNQSVTALNELTNQNVNVDPVPTNVPNAYKTFGLGTQQGLVAYDGVIEGMFAGNLNVAGQDILNGFATFAAGPRVIYGDQGAVTQDFTDPLGLMTYNNTFAADGTRQLDGFVVMFDRPVLISSFTASEVTVKFTSPTGQVTVIDPKQIEIEAVNGGGPFGGTGVGADPNTGAPALATEFFIKFAQPWSKVGSYSYTIGPDISDGIRSITPGGLPNNVNVFQGLSSDTTFFLYVPPPDATIAVGPTDVMEMVNSDLAVYSKNGALLFQDSLYFFFGFALPGIAPFNSTAEITDPFVAYDDSANRFVMGASVLFFDNQTGKITGDDLLFAVSDNSNPLTTDAFGNTTEAFSEVQAVNVTEPSPTGFFAGDFPRFGFNNDAYVITLNMWDPTFTTFDHVEVITINKSTVLNDNTTPMVDSITDLPGTDNFSLVPATMHGTSANGPMYLVEEAGPGNGQAIRVVTETNLLGTTPTFQPNDIPVDPYSSPPLATDTGGTDIQTNTSGNLSAAPILQADWRNNDLVAAQTVGISADANAHARWYEFSTSNAIPTFVQDGTVSATSPPNKTGTAPGSAADTYDPSIAIDTKGDLAITYIQSSATQNMSAYIAYRQPSDPPGQLEAPVLVQSGLAAYTSFFGDFPYLVGRYSGITVDPSDGSFWAVNEYAMGDVLFSFANWGTIIAHFTIPQGTTPTTVNPGNFMDQDANGIAGEAGVDQFSIPDPLNGTPFQAPFDTTTLPLTVPGPHVVATSVPGSTFEQVQNVTVTGVAGSTFTLSYASTPTQAAPASGGNGINVTFQYPGPQPLLSATSNLIGTNPTVSVSDSGLQPSDDVQNISFGGTVTGGSFTLSFDGMTTAPIIWVSNPAALAASVEAALNLILTTTVPLPFNATAAAVEAALNAVFAISAIGGSVSVSVPASTASGGVSYTTFTPPSVYQISFGGALAGTNPPLLTGSSPNAQLNIAAQTNENLMLNGSVSYIDVVFDRNMLPGSFTPADIVSMIGSPGDNTSATSLYVASQSGVIAGGGVFKVTPGTQVNAATLPINPATGLPYPAARVFRVFFPTQTVNGTYQIVFSPFMQQAGDKVDAEGDSATWQVDSNLSAAVDLVRGTSAISAGSTAGFGVVQTVTVSGTGSFTLSFNGQTTAPIPVGAPASVVQGDLNNLSTIGGVGGSVTVSSAGNVYTVIFGGTLASTSPPVMSATASGGATVTVTAATRVVNTYANSTSVAILPGQTAISTINVPDNFIIDQDPSSSSPNHIQVEVNISYPYDPDLVAYLESPGGSMIKLFTNVGNPSAAPTDFKNTVLNDFATTPIDLAGNSFTGTFSPEQRLSTLDGQNAKGKWTLFVQDTGKVNAGSIINWTLQVPHDVLSSGVGNPVADQFTADFNIFTATPTASITQQVFTEVGPQSITDPTFGTVNQNSSRITALAVDPSDPTGNTVYLGGASGGVWKTKDFLTTASTGPTWMPLTDLAPVEVVKDAAGNFLASGSGTNMGGLTVFPVNNDPNQSIIFAATGEGDTASPGIGFLRSEDGGKTWQILDSTDNVDTSGKITPFSAATRDHTFVGDYSFDIVVDPVLNPDPKLTFPNNIIVYAALGGPTGGVWRSVDSGNHWTLLQAGQATSLALPLYGSSLGQNAQYLYAGLAGTLYGLTTGGAGGGVYMVQSPMIATPGGMQLMGGGQGDNSRVYFNGANYVPVPVGNLKTNPNGDNGRIVLATPALSKDPLDNSFYQDWVYAYVVNQNDSTHGVYLTKDQGQNWTQIRLPIRPLPPPPFVPQEGYPSNNDLNNSNPKDPNTDYDIVDHPPQGAQGNYDISMAVDPNNPAVIYVGGVQGPPDPAGGFIRIDTTLMADPYNTVTTDTNDNVSVANSQMTQVVNKATTTVGPLSYSDGYFNPDFNPLNPNAANEPQLISNVLNAFRNPLNVTSDPSTTVYDWLSILLPAPTFTNDGTNATWTPFNSNIANSNNFLFGSDEHRLVAFTDPVTGLTRLILGNDQGVFTVVDNGSGGVEQNIGQFQTVTGPRNGNLQLSQFYQGAAQPSVLAADIAGSMFYGEAQDDGFPQSNSANPLLTGNLTWSGIAGDGYSIRTDQTGSGTTYQYRFPCCINTLYNNDPFVPPFTAYDFILVQQPGTALVSRAQGLILPGDNPDTGAGEWPNVNGFNLVVNPIDPTAALVSSLTGNIFRTVGGYLQGGGGVGWSKIGNPDGSNAQALAFGAPSPSNPNDLSDFIYAGTLNGNIYVTFNGGSGWTQIGSTATGLDGTPVEAISADPVRGSHDLYAATQFGVYYLPDSTAANPKWINITGNLFSLTRPAFNDPNNPVSAVDYLTSLAADWRYAIPFTTAPAGGGPSTHPVLYIGGDGGVFRSLDFGANWTLFPDQSDKAVQTGGDFPSVKVTDLNLVLGNVNPTTGFADPSAGLNMLSVDTYGRGTFVIRLDNSVPVTTATGIFPLSHFLDIKIKPPRITSVKQVLTNNMVTGFVLTFSGPVDPSTVTKAAIDSLTGPNGQPVAVASIQDITSVPAGVGNPHNVYEIVLKSPQPSGAYTLVFGPKVTDFSGDPMSAAFTGTISAPTPPTISAIKNQQSNADAVVTVKFTVGDVQDGAAALVPVATSDNQTLVPNANLVVSGTGANRTLTITPVAGQEGTANITITVTDSLGLTTSVTFQLTVSAGTPPTISAIKDQQSGVGAATTVHFTVGDVQDGAAALVPIVTSDNQTLVPNTNLILSGKGANRTLTITPVAGQEGTANITITVTDSLGLSASVTFRLAVDTPPVIPKVRNQTAPHGQTITLTNFSITSAANNIASTSFTVTPQTTPATTVTYDPVGQTLTVQPPPNFVGTFTVNMSATDTIGGTATGSFKVTLINSPPKYTKTLGNQTYGHNAAAQTLDGSATDADGDTISYTLTGPAWASIDPGSGQITLSGFNTASGTFKLTETASDGFVTVSRLFFVTIVNTPPTLALIPNPPSVSHLAGSLTFNVSATDRGGDPVTFDASLTNGQPNNQTAITVTATTGAVNGSLTTGQVTVSNFGNFAGSFYVTVTASTPTATVKQKVLVTIGDHAPAFTAPLPPATLTVPHTQGSATVNFGLTDADGDPITVTATSNDIPASSGITISASASPTGANTAAGQLVIDGFSNFSGTFHVTLTASDGILSNSRTITVHVTAPAPVFTLSPISAPHGPGSTSVNLTATDPEGLQLNFTASLVGAPAGVTVNASSNPVSGGVTTGVLNISGYNSFAGKFFVSVTASNGISSTTRTVAVTITDVTPRLAPIQGLTIAQGNSGSVTLNASDPDGDPLSYSFQAVASNPLYNLQQRLHLYESSAGLFFNLYGQQEYWLQSATTGGWFALLPNGNLVVGNFNNPAVPFGALVANVGTAAYNNPNLLLNPTPPQSVVPDFSLSGNVLTITPPGGFTGTFEVTVSVSDGVRTASRSFLVTVT